MSKRKEDTNKAHTKVKGKAREGKAVGSPYERVLVVNARKGSSRFEWRVKT